MGSKGQEGTQGCNIIRAIIGALCGCVRGDRQAHHIYFQSSNPNSCRATRSCVQSVMSAIAFEQ